MSLALIDGAVLMKEGRAKWRQRYCGVFERNSEGVERLESYKNRQDFDASRHANYLLLGNCITAKIVTTEINKNVQKAIQLSSAGGHLIWIASDNDDMLRRWHDSICRAAFPNQTYQRSQTATPEMAATPAYSTSTPAQRSPAEDPAYDTPWDLQQFRVLLVPSAATSYLGIGEGTYEVSFGEAALLLKLGRELVRAWEYYLITWFAFSDSSVAFMAEGLVLELKCARPEQFYEKLRGYIPLISDDGDRPAALTHHYYSAFVPRGHPSSRAQAQLPRSPVYAVPFRQQQNDRSSTSFRDVSRDSSGATNKRSLGRRLSQFIGRLSTRHGSPKSPPPNPFGRFSRSTYSPRGFEEEEEREWNSGRRRRPEEVSPPPDDVFGAFDNVPPPSPPPPFEMIRGDGRSLPPFAPDVVPRNPPPTESTNGYGPNRNALFSPLPPEVAQGARPPFLAQLERHLADRQRFNGANNGGGGLRDSIVSEPAAAATYFNFPPPLQEADMTLPADYATVQKPSRQPRKFPSVRELKDIEERNEERRVNRLSVITDV